MKKALRFFVRGELCPPMTETDPQASLWRTENLVQHTFWTTTQFFILHEPKGFDP
ncbi:hypothetical protein [Moraxella bovis]|uniref:hypothetical protein n=1 Tax=Moraxella bovis TaxID=476 RepID=UPI0013010004|nr:hypothetical protein [Moraxella bovis]UYZ69519.1 hypothetical protein LP122_05550 [Moraxella bovis]UYZ71891.1 hypothetical protein LP089_05600 [Moraxella bovis]UYZ72197.1 hypothetical protein LP105_07080 [Moraxella bovis]UYZ79979.1 hypothetical protein LP113_07900 [Moraxella bovis]UZA05039.1 hypothetical protein LP099_07595 [Moraxella bovis]